MGTALGAGRDEMAAERHGGQEAPRQTERPRPAERPREVQRSGLGGRPPQQKSLSNDKPNSLNNSNGHQTDRKYGKQKSFALTVCYTSLTVCKLFGAEPDSLLTRRPGIHTVVRLKSVWGKRIPFAFRKANGLSHSTAIVVCILTVCILFASRPTSCVREQRAPTGWWQVWE